MKYETKTFRQSEHALATLKEQNKQAYNNMASIHRHPLYTNLLLRPACGR